MVTIVSVHERILNIDTLTTALNIKEWSIISKPSNKVPEVKKLKELGLLKTLLRIKTEKNAATITV